MEVLEQLLDVVLGHPAPRERLAERTPDVDHVVPGDPGRLVRSRQRIGVADERGIVRQRGEPPEDLVRRSFVFLLAREPKESILGRFDLPLIGRYFPEYEREIRR